MFGSNRDSSKISTPYVLKLLRYASFFTGAMGLDLGLEQAGWHCAFANEIDSIACSTIRANRPQTSLAESDIRQLARADLPAEIDLVAGGPPCQAFSTAGRRLGLSDERGNVFLHFIDLALALQPKMIAIENVRGLLSAPLVHRPHHQRGKDNPPLSEQELPGGALRHIIERLNANGYETSMKLYNTAEFGVPQLRNRIVLFGSRIGTIPAMSPTVSEFETFQESVEGLGPEPEYNPLRANQVRFLRHLKSGQNWRDLPLAMQREALGKAFDSTGGRTGFYRRLAWDQPSPTLVTSPTMPATLLAHPCEERPLSVQEYARLQTFPDEWKFAGTTSQKYRQIGNAVPVTFARAIGEHLASWIS